MERKRITVELECLDHMRKEFDAMRKLFGGKLGFSSPEYRKIAEHVADVELFAIDRTRVLQGLRNELKGK